MKVATQKGITLIVLVVTIVILLILAGITIYSAFNKDGLIDTTKEFKNIVENTQDGTAQKIENLLGNLEGEILGEGSAPQDKTGPTVIVTKEAVGTNFIEVTVTATDEQSGMPANPEYKYYIKPTSTTTWPTMESCNGTNTSYTFMGLVQNTSYDIKVTTQDMAGNTGEKILAITTIQDETGPIITITKGTVTTNSIQVTVTATDEQSGMPTNPEYKYYIKPTSTTTWPTTASYSGTNTNYTFTELTQNTSYDIKVTTQDIAGNTGEKTLTEIKTTQITGGLETGEITVSEVTWSSGLASITLSTTTSLTIQYKVGESGTWTTGTSVTGLKHGDVVYARLTDGNNYGSEASVNILDGINPIASITLSTTSTNVGQAITATVILTDNESGINTTSCKYIFNTTSSNIETTSSVWNSATAFSSNNQTISLTKTTTETFYLHVLTVDIAGNKTETVSQAVMETDPKDIYVTLYTDGTLGFNNNSEAMSGKTVQTSYGNIRGQAYTAKGSISSGNSTTPWNEDKDSILLATFNSVIIPENTDYWFYNCSNMTEITNISKLDTNQVTSMSNMFSGCKGLTSLDLSNFNTSKVTDMGSMFNGCTGLTSLDVRNFNTNNVTYMWRMFNGCKSLTSLDVSNFNTSQVTDMGNMFFGCNSLTSLDVSEFDTSNVRWMGNMFHNCKSLTSLDVSNFNTSSVIEMSGMFSFCSNITSLNLSRFNTSNVIWMGSMFTGCSSLTSLNLSNFNTSNVTNMEGMFQTCSSLTSLNISNFDTSKVTTMYYMFADCRNLTSLDLTSFNTSQVTEMSIMFNNCVNLTTIYASNNFVTTNVTNSKDMFYPLTKLVGGNGTRYNSSYLDKTYARIDKAGAPGYFTQK